MENVNLFTQANFFQSKVSPENTKKLPLNKNCYKTKNNKNDKANNTIKETHAKPGAALQSPPTVREGLEKIPHTGDKASLDRCG